MLSFTKVISFFLQIEQKNKALVYVEYTSMQKNTIPDIYSQLSVPDRNHLELPQNKFVPSAIPNFWNITMPPQREQTCFESASNQSLLKTKKTSRRIIVKLKAAYLLLTEVVEFLTELLVWVACFISFDSNHQYVYSLIIHAVMVLLRGRGHSSRVVTVGNLWGWEYKPPQ